MRSTTGGEHNVSLPRASRSIGLRLAYVKPLEWLGNPVAGSLARQSWPQYAVRAADGGAATGRRAISRAPRRSSASPTGSGSSSSRRRAASSLVQLRVAPQTRAPFGAMTFTW